MKMEPIVSSETSEIRTQTPGNYPKRNKLQFEIVNCMNDTNEQLQQLMQKFSQMPDRLLASTELM